MENVKGLIVTVILAAVFYALYKLMESVRQDRNHRLIRKQARRLISEMRQASVSAYAGRRRQTVKLADKLLELTERHDWLHLTAIGTSRSDIQNLLQRAKQGPAEIAAARRTVRERIVTPTPAPGSRPAYRPLPALRLVKPSRQAPPVPTGDKQRTADSDDFEITEDVHPVERLNAAMREPSEPLELDTYGSWRNKSPRQRWLDQRLMAGFRPGNESLFEPRPTEKEEPLELEMNDIWGAMDPTIRKMTTVKK